MPAAFFRSFQTPGCAVDETGRYTYRDPETGAVHDLHWLFGWLYLWTPLLLLVTALVLLVVLVIGLVADWMRRRKSEQRTKAIDTGEVIYEVAAAKRRETARYDQMDTATLRAAKVQVRAEREQAFQTAAQADAALKALTEWTPGPPSDDRTRLLRALNDQLAAFNTGVQIEPTTGELLSADVPRRRLVAAQRKQARIAQDRTEALEDMPPIYEAVKPRFWGEYTGYQR